ncbi:peptide deformylase [Solidesulfovibrio carbinoliphilus subsp. oakridgensis]|uniref:Peptide deformylase n=1 Tax=Solidesulfovibrio carbinoliphilus subsp. oakridgensis TaxID=694327 RepID=G7Q8E4_9BACT|nr:peptide deformylase [Solidesulfovibrio carbinoliphilus]EHJ48556.1 peptide deformylase [Solidesulfovibrio carbinoliphilus subsp. oakridgensis]
MSLEILKYPHPTLAQKAAPVTEITPEIRELAAAMAETMYANQGIGLAAPQVGRSIRLVVIDLSGPDKREGLMTLVNPVITDPAGEEEDEEGCLSVRDYRTNVVRAATVTVKATDLDGNPFCLEADGLLAVCLQHEIDHLDGVLFIDHISRLKRAMYDKRVKRWARQEAEKDRENS